MADLDRYEAELGISGPLIGENGAVARVGRGKELLDLGVSQQPLSSPSLEPRYLHRGSNPEFPEENRAMEVKEKLDMICTVTKIRP